MAKVEERPQTTSFRWRPSAEDDFIATIERLQESGDIPEGISRSEAIRRVLNGWSEDPNTEYLE